MKINRVSYLILAVIITIAGTCGSLFPSPYISSQTLRIAISDQIDSIDPYTNRGFSEWAGNVFEGLVKLDSSLRPLPAIAESWGNPDDHSWEFRLGNILFSDGTPVEPKHVVSAFRSFQQKSPNLAISENIKSIEQVPSDPSKIVIKTVETNPDFLQQLAQIYIPKNDGETFIGSGPFQINNWEPKNRLILNKNSFYDRDEISWNQIKFLTVTDNKQYPQLISNGDIDMAISSLPLDETKLNLAQNLSASLFNTSFSTITKNNKAYLCAPDIIFQPHQSRSILASEIHRQQ